MGRFKDIYAVAAHYAQLFALGWRWVNLVIVSDRLAVGADQIGAVVKPSAVAFQKGQDNMRGMRFGQCTHARAHRTRIVFRQRTVVICRCTKDVEKLGQAAESGTLFQRFAQQS